MPVRHRGRLGDPTTRRPGRWAVVVRTADGATETLDARCGHQRGGCAQPAEAARHPGHGRLRRPVVPLGALGPPTSTTAASGSRSSAPARAASRSRRPSPTMSSSSPCSSAPRSGCSRTPTTTERVPDGERWAMRHLPFYGRWFRFLTFYPGAGLTIDELARRPELRRRRTQPSAPRNAETRELFSRAGCLAARLTTRAAREVDARLPGHRQAHAAGQRLVAGLPAEGQRRAGAHRHRAHRGRRRGHRRRQALPADVICYATGFRHNDFLWPMHIAGRDGRVLREQWGDEPTAYLGITVPNFPEPVLPLRAGHQPRARRAA